VEGPHILMKFAIGKPVEVRVNGVKGSACRAFSKPFEDAIGGKVVADVPTAEMTQPATVGAEVKAGGGKTF